VFLDLDAIFHPERSALDIGPDGLPEDWREHWEERTAIMMSDAGLSKEHAEAAALADVLEVMRREGIDPTRR
jgi:hypothetical protein